LKNNSYSKLPECANLLQLGLGGLIGVYRESVTTTLSIMETYKLIKVSRRKITLLDKQGLKELSEY
jgi:hypothetical protein